ncbi:hypothetical protein SAMN04489740_0230 [Arthrobacter alpinus]|uniref:Transposase n=1 Tax=Arthrobacter alpinus TaxID=656366 RepID=A0A1H5EEU7_9MICC|nr:hypothetical protein [Arthrobacter alpinus]SED89629.1 hypothetical protein SAMN04489740_0230 [Arthrobacter alpinus]
MGELRWGNGREALEDFLALSQAIRRWVPCGNDWVMNQLNDLK